MAPLRAPIEVEEFWDDLLAFIEERLVIPVVGAELLTIDDSGQPVPLYRVAAERLLRKYRPAGAANDVVLREHFELNDAVCALVAAGRRVNDLYRPIHEDAAARLSLGSQRYKVLLSFREDFLPAVEGWKRDIPSIMRNRLRLLPMSGEQAFDAIHVTVRI
jgi:hypothetical protein